MAVSEQTPYIEYEANGVTKSFALEFDCSDKNHLIVMIDDFEPAVDTWSLSDGAVVFSIAPELNKKISIKRNTPFRRDSDFQSYDNSFRPKPVNENFDWIWWKLQELGVADWILGARIDALKNYVDRKDDELKAYLMEEIRKQGVALDQLDEYYNYLMQRLAQIAVDKGWDASFVVDGDMNQKQINDSVRSKNAEHVSVDDFYSSKLNHSKNTQTLASSAYLTLSDLQKDYAFADSLDWSVDALALQAFFNYITKNRAHLAVCAGDFFSSHPLNITYSTSDLVGITRNVIFNANIKGMGTGANRDLLTITGGRKAVFTGNLELWGRVTGEGYSGRTWSNGLKVNNCRGLQLKWSYNARYFKRWAVDGTSESGNNNFVEYGSVGAYLCGSRRGDVTLNFSAVNNTGSADSEKQRSVLTVDKDISQNINNFGSYLVINNEFYLIVSATTTDVTIYPWITTTTSGSAELIAGGCARIFGNDSNIQKFSLIEAGSCAIAYLDQSFYSGTQQRISSTSCVIGEVRGGEPGSKLFCSTSMTSYFESNEVDIMSHSSADSSALFTNPIEISFNKIKQLCPKNEAGVSSIAAVFKPAVLLKGRLIKALAVNRTDSTSSSTISAKNGDEDYKLNGTTTVTLTKDADMLRLFALSDVSFVSMNTAALTFKCETGFTINGSSSDLVLSEVKYKRVHARLVGTNWRVAVFYDEISNISATATYDPPSLAAGAQQSTTVTLVGAALGNTVLCSFSKALNGTRLWAEVTAANTVTVYHRNDTGAAVDIAIGLLKVAVVF